MKSLLLLLFLIPFYFHNPNKNWPDNVDGKSSQRSSTNEVTANELAGQWIRLEAGEDVNKNRILEESEKMKLEPSPQDNMYLNSDGKCKMFGMGMELEGTWLTKNYNGKKTLFIYTDDIMDLPQEQRDKSAMRFEVLSLKDGKLLVVPPIYISMLVVYWRTK